ncbi:hypothetical protein [Deinococcus ficus]|uniref:Uncharacterized protein n=1 Tax=Deinococcus ficus TaxID=317577 RepID=A0A221T2Q0_9DEIO|nr:hypothetical protein [Deinococcus ficus]ASN83175.1 hypothetical protein DFI_18415 [Deinococcus ficus]
MQHVYFPTAHHQYATRLVFGDTEDLQLVRDTYTPPETRPEYQRQLRQLEHEAARRGLGRDQRRIVAGLKVTPLHTFTIPVLITDLTRLPDGVHATFLCVDQDVAQVHSSVILDAQGRPRAPVAQGE